MEIKNGISKLFVIQGHEIFPRKKHQSGIRNIQINPKKRGQERIVVLLHWILLPEPGETSIQHRLLELVPPAKLKVLPKCVPIHRHQLQTHWKPKASSEDPVEGDFCFPSLRGRFFLQGEAVHEDE